MKMRIFLLLLILVLLLSACGASKVYTVEERGMTFTVDTENGTITQGDTVYQYEISGNTYTITYPDGATYSMSWSGPIGTGGGSGSYYDSPRVDGDILTDILKDNQPKEKNPENFLLGLLCIGLGILNAAAPYAAWFIGHGWRYEYAEPSEAYLTVIRIFGIIAIIVGIIALFL